MVFSLEPRWPMSRSVKNDCNSGANALMAASRDGPRVGLRPVASAPARLLGTNYSELGITGITPILGLFRCPLLPARKRPGTLADALWQLSPVGIIRCQSLSPHRRWIC